MRSLILTGWTGSEFAKIASHTVPIIEDYATRHGALFACVNLCGDRPASWHKVPYIIQALEQVEQVAWIDSDVVVERHERNIFDELTAESWMGLVEHHTECGTVPNCGVWVVRKPLLPYLRDIWGSGEHINHPWWEQAAMIEKLGFKLTGPTEAKFEAPTELYHKTSWLGAEWNHHPNDTRKVEIPRFRHVTMYPNRLDVIRYHCDLTQSHLNTNIKNTELSKQLFDDNFARHIPNNHKLRDLVQENFKESSSETSIFAAELYPKLVWGKNIVDMQAFTEEMRNLAIQVELIPDKNIGIFGLGPLLPYINLTKKNLIIFDNDTGNIAKTLGRVPLHNTSVKFCESSEDFFSSSPDMILVYEPFLNQNPELGIQLEKYLFQLNKRSVKNTATLSNLKVLVQARPNLYTDRGGDTIALERSTEALRLQGVDAVIDIENRENPRDYDIVHLYNFSTPEAIEPLARNAVNQNVPFVVTTLYEELPLFFSKMKVYGQAITEYNRGAYPNVSFDQLLDAIKGALTKDISTIERNNNFAAQHASALLSSGMMESVSLKKDFPQAKNIRIVPFGCSGLPDTGPNLFTERYGVSDFILCVGRIEWRKNQAMLLQAFEDSDLPIVLVAGNMTYQPDYQEQVSKFRRKGRTVIVSKLSLEELASAYRAARVHVLPSWFELPGLVSLEAAKVGTPVVGTTYGTLPDYLGNEAYYCNPESIESIRTITEKAFLEGKNNRSKLIELANRYTWTNTATRLIEVYDSVLSGAMEQDDYTRSLSNTVFEDKYPRETTSNLHQY